MAYSFIFDSFKYLMYQGYSFAINQNVKVTLVGATFDGDAVKDSATVWADVSSTAIANTTKTLQNVVVDDTGAGCKVKADDVVWTLSTISDAYGAVFYDGANNLICYMDFGGAKSTQNGTFQIKTSNGFIKTP